MLSGSFRFIVIEYVPASLADGDIYNSYYCAYNLLVATNFAALPQSALKLVSKPDGDFINGNL